MARTDSLGVSQQQAFKEAGDVLVLIRGGGGGGGHGGGIAGAAHRSGGGHMTGRLRLSVAEARELAEGALVGIGYAHDEARIIADHVIDAALCGYEYSGLAKILNVPESEHFRLPRRPMQVLRETEISLAFDGGNNVGMQPFAPLPHRTKTT